MVTLKQLDAKIKKQKKEIQAFKKESRMADARGRMNVRRIRKGLTPLKPLKFKKR